ncbi:MAG: DUF2510 domain-containing protein [Actinomycetota bacterium]|nr:MAG: DUF2510 domain-containing protein [Actinomycetota bacterium]
MAYQTSPATPGAPQPRKGKTALITGAVLLAVSIVIGVIGVVGVVATAKRLLNAFGDPFQTPAQVTVSLDAGKTYAVFSRLGARYDSISPAEVSVRAPNGSTVPVRDPGSGGDSFTTDGYTYLATATFVAPTSGAYSVSVQTAGAVAVVAPTFGNFLSTAVFGLLVGLAVLIGIAAVVLLIVGAVRRSSSRRPATPLAQAGPGQALPGQPIPGQAVPGQPTPGQPIPGQPGPAAPSAGPPPGWYPDAQRPGGQRYWDGRQWTEHRA